ncbi:hypothetical protein [Nonomuraea sp. SBT364]|uniref:hypothetical protein n=1 Tax=Nonomuraea sp. SBT364 TaxID=1580530 RepID=UPI000B16AFF2|nr:hypothetical protein [Nonomuraea sp. SBT364]
MLVRSALAGLGAEPGRSGVCRPRAIAWQWAGAGDGYRAPGVRRRRAGVTAHYGRIFKTLHLLQFIADVTSWLTWCQTKKHWTAPAVPADAERRKKSADETRAVEDAL